MHLRDSRLPPPAPGSAARGLHATRPRTRSCALLLVLLGSLLLATAALAEGDDGETPRFELSGFGTLGVVRSNSDDVQFARDQSQPKGATRTFSAAQDSLLGVQAYWRASESLDLTAQAVSRYGARGNYSPEIMAAFVRQAVTPNVNLRAGRLGLEFYMLADSRLVGYSYLTVRPPNDVFAPLVPQYIDGADVTLAQPLGGGIAKFKAFLGVANEEAPIDSEFMSLHGNPVAGAYADYQDRHWQWRATYAQMRFRHDLPDPVASLRDALTAAGAIDAAHAIALRDTRTDFYSLGIVYDNGPFQVQGMLSAVRNGSALYQDADAGYIVAGYRWHSVTPFVGYSWNRSRAKDVGSGLPDIPAYAELNTNLADALAHTHTNQNTLILGTRWDIRRDVALKAQVDLIRGARDSVFLYPRTDSAFDGKLNVFSLAVDFVF